MLSACTSVRRPPTAPNEMASSPSIYWPYSSPRRPGGRGRGTSPSTPANALPHAPSRFHLAPCWHLHLHLGMLLRLVCLTLFTAVPCVIGQVEFLTLDTVPQTFVTVTVGFVDRPPATRLSSSRLASQPYYFFLGSIACRHRI